MTDIENKSLRIKVSYVILARISLVLHILLVAMFPIGGILILFFPVYIPFHIAIVFSTLYFHIFKSSCPLTSFEKKLLRIGRGYDYPTPCWRHYIFIGMFKRDVSNEFVKKFLIITTVLPSLLPLLYLLIKYLVLNFRA